MDENKREPTNETTTSDLYGAPTLAVRLDVCEQTVYRMRRRNEGPPFVRIGRHIKYRRADVEAWLAAGGTPEKGK